LERNRRAFASVYWPTYGRRYCRTKVWLALERGWWKPKGPRRDLIRAAALIVAEIERIDRRAPTPEPRDRLKASEQRHLELPTRLTRCMLDTVTLKRQQADEILRTNELLQKMVCDCTNKLMGEAADALAEQAETIQSCVRPSSGS